MKADKILFNGVVYPMNGHRSEAVAVLGDEILAVGSNRELESLCDSNTMRIDLQGRTILPGFNDTHVHLVGYGSAFDAVDLNEANSISEMIQRCKDFLKEHPRKPGQWLYGRGWNQNLFEEDGQRFPTREDLDQIQEGLPVLLLRVCGHIGLASTKALEHVDVIAQTFIPGGEFDLGTDGKPNGIIREAALEWFKKNIKSNTGLDEIKQAILTGSEVLLANGITSVHTEDSYDLGYGGSFEDIHQAYQELIEEKKLPIRIYQKISLPKQEDIKSFLATGRRTGDGDDWYRIGPVKQWCDGTMGARTAALLEEYSDDPGNLGILVYPEEELYENVKLAHNSDMQMCLHAIGDRALETALNAYERVLEEFPKEHRHRIVHCQVGNLEQYKRLARLGLNINIQPLSTAVDYPIMNARLGEKREKEAHNWRTLTDLGVLITASSDVPVEDPNVFYGVHAVVNRCNIDGDPQGGWLPEQGITVEEALMEYTINPAIAAFEEHRKGTLVAGKLADLVILDKDPFRTPKEELKEIKVLATMVGGEFNYEKVTR